MSESEDAKRPMVFQTRWILAKICFQYPLLFHLSIVVTTVARLPQETQLASVK